MVIKVAYRLIAPYWKSADRKVGIALAVGIMLLAALHAFLSIQFNAAYANFYGAIQRLNAKDFWGVVPLLLGLVAVTLTTTVFQDFVQSWLQLRWRRGLVSNLLDRWFDEKAYYRIERNEESDNPDQRISEDVKQFVALTMTLTLGFASMLMTLGSFSYITWTKGGDLNTEFLGYQLYVPGYMFWLAVVFSVVQTAITHFAGRRLIGINFESEAKEADFRYHLVQVRDNAEQIAMYSGEPTERTGLLNKFRGIWSVSKKNFVVTAQLGAVTAFIGGISSLLPIFVMMPSLFAGKSDFGTLMAVTQAWVALTAAFGWFAARYATIAQWRAVAARLDSLMDSINRPAPTRKIEVSPLLPQEKAAIQLTDVQLELPNGAALSGIGSLTIGAGDRWMITGRTGAGKSTLLRAIAGIWPYGTGTVGHSAAARLMFLPQKSYISAGTLKAALCYPQDGDAYSDRECTSALVECRLGQFVDRLHEYGNWSKSMSLGEQQRLAVARAILTKPDVLFLDEATSSVDQETEAALYAAIIARLPETSLVSVAHRVALKDFHSSFLNVEPTPSKPADVGLVDIHSSLVAGLEADKKTQ